MDKLELDIIKDILKSRMALHDFGKPVKKVINEKIAEINKPTLIVLNLRGANPMDYEFVNISFNDIINQSKVNSNLFIVFKVDKGEFDELCTGIVDILNLKIEKGETERTTLEKNKFSMMYVDEDNLTQYLSHLSSRHMEVLTQIENTTSIASSDIQAKFSLNAEDTWRIINDLLNNKFIIKIDGPKYIAVKSFI